MGEWFGNSNILPFHAFEWYHLLMILTYLIGIAFLLIYSNTFKHKQNITTRVRWGLFFILVTSELSYQTWGLVNQTWNVREFLPFQLCSLAGILSMIALYSRNHKLIQILFFIGIVPSFLAVVTPELYYGVLHFRFWQFFIHHIALSWACILLVISNPITITFKKAVETYFYLLVYAALIGFILNPILNANFLFLSSTPGNNTPLNLLGSGFWYYVNLCFVGLAVFLIIYFIYKITIRRIDLKRAKENNIIA